MSTVNTKHEMKLRELSKLNQIGQEFSSSLELDRVIDRIMNRVREVLKCEASSVILWDEVKSSLVFYAASGAGAQDVKGLSIPRGKGVAGWVFDNQEAVIVENAQDDSRFYPEIDKITGMRTASLICVPIRKKNRMLGVIEGMNKVEGTFVQKDLEMLTAISQLAEISIENSIIHKNIERKNEELVQLNSEMEDFVHIVAHDLQTPLASIEGYIDLIRSEMADYLKRNSGINTYIGRIDENSRNMLGFIRRLLAYSKLKRGKTSIDDFNPMGVLREILVLLHAELKDKKVQVVLPDNMVSVRYDRYLFHHIMLNLIQNSFRYTKDVKNPVIEIGIKEEDYELHFFVKNNGPGLSEKEQERIFNVYDRGGDQKLLNGYGVGLAFVKKAVEMFDGIVWVENQPGEGTTFFFSIPH
jgi:signal transduction histidine kinase